MKRKRTDKQPETNSPAETIAEVMLELNRLTTEADALSEQARQTVEDQWHVQHTELFPRLCAWKEDVSATVFSTFTLQNSALQFVPLLSDAQSPQFEAAIPLRRPTDALDTTYGPKSMTMVGLCMCSHNMQFDFKNESIYFPIVFFDRCVGVVAARIPGLQPGHYQHISQTTANMLDTVRHNLFHRLSINTRRPMVKAS